MFILSQYCGDMNVRYEYAYLMCYYLYVYVYVYVENNFLNHFIEYLSHSEINFWVYGNITSVFSKLKKWKSIDILIYRRFYYAGGFCTGMLGIV